VNTNVLAFIRGVMHVAFGALTALQIQYPAWHWVTIALGALAFIGTNGLPAVIGLPPRAAPTTPSSSPGTQ